jgi:hypothetical protein
MGFLRSRLVTRRYGAGLIQPTQNDFTLVDVNKRVFHKHTIPLIVNHGHELSARLRRFALNQRTGQTPLPFFVNKSWFSLSLSRCHLRLVDTQVNRVNELQIVKLSNRPLVI